MDAPGPERRARERLLRLLGDDRPERAVWIDRLKARFRLEDLPVCATAAEVLLGGRYPEAEAEAFLRQVEDHRGELADRIGRDPGLVVAAADYLETLGVRHTTLAAAERSDRPGLAEGASRPRRRPGARRALERELRRHVRRPGEVSVLRFSLDAIDQVARQHGGLMASFALERAEAAVREALRDTDFTGRWGERDLACVLPETSRRGAYEAADRARIAVAGAFAGPRAASGRPGMTVSCGLAVHPEDGASADELWERAEAGLVAAQTSGGDRVWLHHAERRRDVRHGVREGWTVLVGPEAEDLAYPAVPLDLSRGGIGLETSEAFVGATRVRLLLGGLGDPAIVRRAGPWVVTGRVARLGAAGSVRGRRRIGVAFETPLPEACFRPRIEPWRPPKASMSGERP